MDNRIKILLPDQKGITSENVDLFLNLDMNMQFNEFKKETFDNDFDLAAQFVKERNESRDFVVYGEIDSTVIDCTDIQIRVYADSGYTNLINIIRTTKVSYDTDNVFGKRKGKYYIKLRNYPHESVYFKILSNNFSYRDQKWSQRLIFRDADNGIVPYGTETIDVNSDGNVITINNDFPFFFNKHWIRLDYNFIEEKKAKASFNINSQSFREGDTGQVSISLDKPSPFGLEMLTVRMREESSFSDFMIANTFNNVGSGNDIIINAPLDMPQFADKATFIAQIPVDKTYLIQSGLEIRVLDGSYVGYHTILHTSSITIGSYTDLYLFIISADYNEFGTNGTPMSFRVGTAPDITFELNGTRVDFPFNMSWAVNERTKTLSFTANTDFEVEFTEFVILELTDFLNVKKGRIPETKIVYEDTTPRNYVQLFFGPAYENYAHFTGRTFSILNNIAPNQTIASPSVLRNGYIFENRNEEFYPSAGYTLKVRNEGGRTLFPANPNFGINEDTLFAVGDTRTIPITTQFAGTQKHKIRIAFPYYYSISPYNISGSSVHLFYSINGKRTIANSRGYLFFKEMITGAPGIDWWEHYGIEKPFDYELNDTDFVVTLTSKSPGVKIDFVTNDYLVTATTLTNFYEKNQIEQSIVLYANHQDNTEARYSFSIEKNGYRRLTIPADSLMAGSTPIPYYLATSYSNIMRPYYDDIQQTYYGSASTIDDQNLTYYQIDFAQPSYMPKGAAIINGVALLADNIISIGLPTRENLTNYGLGEGQFVAGFLPQRVQPIIGTYEIIAQVPSKKAIELTIPYDNSYTNPYIRGFDFKFGTYGDETVFRFTGTGFNLRQSAQWWWSNNIPAKDITGVQLPNATLQERLDTGNLGNSVTEGPVSGFLLDNKTLRLVAKQEGHDFEIENIVNYVNSSVNEKIAFETIVPHVLAGDINPSNNGLGGFAISV